MAIMILYIISSSIVISYNIFWYCFKLIYSKRSKLGETARVFKKFNIIQHDFISSSLDLDAMHGILHH